MNMGSGSEGANTSRLLPWVGWNSSEGSFVVVSSQEYGRRPASAKTSSGDVYVDVTRLWWERFAGSGDWKSAAALAQACTEKRPELPYGWENWAWALHKLGRTREAYRLLAPILKKLKLPGPPSGRAAFCLSCFCAALDKKAEGRRWLNVAFNLAVDKDALKQHAVHEPDLREIWPGMPQFGDAITLFD
jgi:hypothetical protein